MSSPTATGEWVRWMTSHGRAVSCAQLPVTDTVCPTKYSR
jgi:hypothetical protein